MLAIYDVPAPAKLNLFLHVVGKRADGYHLLESIFALIDWQDTLHFERRSDGLLQRHDRGDALPEDDLCLRAARLLQQETGCTFGADIHIEKRLPSGAGMGGGSSDAASTLLALNRLWNLNLKRGRMLELGLRLGADVPFFVGGTNAFVQGIGEQLQAIELPVEQYAVLKPPVSIPTQAIFSSPLLARSDSVAIVAGFPAYKQGKNQNDLRNDLQKAAEGFSGEVVQALAALESVWGGGKSDGKSNCRMTGSGSAVFASIGSRVDADREDGRSDQSMATLLQALPAGWVGRICRSLVKHPLRDWAED